MKKRTRLIALLSIAGFSFCSYAFDSQIIKTSIEKSDIKALSNFLNLMVALSKEDQKAYSALAHLKADEALLSITHKGPHDAARALVGIPLTLLGIGQIVTGLILQRCGSVTDAIAQNFHGAAANGLGIASAGMNIVGLNFRPSRRNCNLFGGRQYCKNIYSLR